MHGVERAVRRVGKSADDGGRHPRRCRRFRQLHCRPVARRCAARHHAAEFRSLHHRPHAGPEHHGQTRRSAGIHQGALGLSRSSGERRSHRAGPRASGPICDDLRRGRAYLWRQPLYRRRDLGCRIELRHAWRRSSGYPLDRDARLRRPPPRLFPRRVPVGAGNPAARRCSAGAPDRILGRRFRSDAVHADVVQALRGGFRRRRAP